MLTFWHGPPLPGLFQATWLSASTQNEEYVKVKTADGYTYYMAHALVEKVLGEDVEVLETYQGKELEFKEYEPLYDCSKPYCEKQHKKGHYVVCDTYVTLTDGTGIVHIAPAFGEDDANVGRKYDLPFVQLVDAKGDMTEDTPFGGRFVKDADPLVLKDLEERGLLFSAPSFEHSYPHCWRCGTPLIYYARESWFIKMTAVKDDLIRNNNTVNWVPESIGKGRFGDWLENIQDWGISRNRYWGTPLNIWECEGCGHQHSVGSIEELKSLSDNCPDEIELHRPYIDAVTIKCPHCGGVMKRVPEVIDCWFDSGSMPFAQWHYPFENKEIFEDNFPANFISEAVDQTRGWFYSLMAISTLLFNKAPYKNVVVLGHVQDENGQKMSKSKGNVVSPDDLVRDYGCDSLRMYELFVGPPELDAEWDESGIDGVHRFLTRFYKLIMDQKDKGVEADKELLKVRHKLIYDITTRLNNFSLNTVVSGFMEYTNTLTAMAKKSGVDKETLETAIVLLAPFAPHIAEELWEAMGHEDSVFAQTWPTYDEEAMKEDEVEIVVQINGK